VLCVVHIEKRQSTNLLSLQSTCIDFLKGYVVSHIQNI